MDFIRISFQKMCKAMPGGWSAMAAAMAAAMGLSLPNLENRVYNRRNQAMDVHEALQLQEFSGTTLFAEAVAQVSRCAMLLNRRWRMASSSATRLPGWC